MPQQSVLNAIVARIAVGFVGDIMDMRGKKLHISLAVQEFFRNCDCLIGNFEATITRARKTGPAAQVHDPSILDALAELFPPDRTFLSVANNHAGDFPQAIFRQSLDSLRKRGFRVFGLRQAPFADIAGCVRVAGASMWSNRPCREIAPLASLDKCRGPIAFSIAYPHWGYELEMFPRPAIVHVGDRLLQTYGAVMGHHSHVPQPLAGLQCDNVTKPLAFSLGDFCTGLRIKKFQYGMICKVEIGPGEAGVWRIGAANWRYTRALPDERDAVKINFVPDLTL
ncbi:MAG: CapA family protein [Deltaproteobacteria bacterium]|nr:CapA family protein [Deltaproteobacteria bacterium]